MVEQNSTYLIRVNRDPCEEDEILFKKIAYKHIDLKISEILQNH